MPVNWRPLFEVLTGYAPGQWRLNNAQLARIQHLASTSSAVDHYLARFAGPCYRIRRASGGPGRLQRAAARALLSRMQSGGSIPALTRHSIQRRGRTAGPRFRRRYRRSTFSADRTQNALCSACWDTAPGDRAPLHFATVRNRGKGAYHYRPCRVCGSEPPRLIQTESHLKMAKLESSSGRVPATE
jgi:hypothetical protein